jgi:uncharacterized repeat protein (TIGR01451 family)
LGCTYTGTYPVTPNTQLPPITLTVTVSTTAASSLVNTATVAALAGETVLANNTALDTTTINGAGVAVSGLLYADANHNAAQDGAEGSTSLSGLYIKLAPSVSGSCQTPATQTAAISATGTYTLPTVLPGTYCLILTNSAVLTNTTPYLPPGWLGTEAPSGIRQITTANNATSPQNFGLYNGSQLTLRVFNDTGVGAGTAHDAVQNGAEAGIPNLTVNATSGATIVATSTTDAMGNAVLWLPATTSGTITISPIAPTGYLATGGSAGTTAGTYTRPVVNFTFASGNAYTGLRFGLIPPSTLSNTGVQTAQAGTVVYHPHTFTAGSVGQVSFTTTAIASGAVTGWSETLLQDPGCTGLPSASNPPLTSPIAVTAGQQICLLLKEFIPATAPVGASNVVTLTATQTYTGSQAPANAILTRTDTTTVGATGSLTLGKKVQNITLASAYGTTNNAMPGHTLQYQLTFTNLGAAPLSTVVVNDTTPAFTTFLSAACPASLPANLSACTLTTQPLVGATGNVVWTFTGTLAPGGQSQVTYQVKVAQ